MTRRELITATQNECNKLFSYSWRKFRNCKACTKEIYINHHKCIALRSYNTIVALYSTDTKTVYEFDRYSATTTQHVRKFICDMDSEKLIKLHQDTTGILEQCLIYPFHTIEPTKYTWNIIVQEDFKDYIESFA